MDSNKKQFIKTMSILKHQTNDSLLTVLITMALVISVTLSDYQEERENILEQEISQSLGGQLELCDDEQQANDIIMGYKETEWNQSFTNPKNYKFSKHYFLYKDQIQASVLYRIIQMMPKGAALHVHGSFALNTDYLMKITYEDNLYACYSNDKFIFRFADDVPKLPCVGEWKLLSKLRESAGDVQAFDLELRQHLSLVTVDEEILNSPSKMIWEKFDKIHATTRPLLTYRPVREQHFLDTLKRFYEDNVMYIELRSGLPCLYELNGTEWDPSKTLKLFCEITKKFIKDHPDFYGVKFILTQDRNKPPREVKKALNLYKKMKNKYPDMMAGFDLVGHEESQTTLEDFAPVLLENKDEANYFLHAGESIWLGSSADENLIDAILLGAKRIGHGFNLAKHPVLVNLIKKKNIAVEVNIISNLVLGLVKDIRNHPLSNLLALNVPIVLSSDDPGLWDGPPASHDFYIAFIAVASRRADLRVLKQLALNSITYSALNSHGKKKLNKIFNKRWDAFITEVISSYDNDARRTYRLDSKMKHTNQTINENVTVTPEVNTSSTQSLQTHR